MDNFVDIIGFQLEKVHTSVISWILDTENPSVPVSDKITVLNRLLPSSQIDINDVNKIKPIREYSFGRRRRIDLVIEIIDKNSNTRYLVIECKTDSDVNFEQLRQSKDNFLKEKGISNSNCLFFVLALGASQFTYQHLTDKIKDFEVLDLLKTKQIFSDLSVKGKSRIYDDWCNSIEEEMERFEKIETSLKDMESPWDDRLRGLGYRIGFPIFYMFYAKLREHLNNSPYKNWAIYSGSNNPVMNWQDGWIDIDKTLSLYFEFNWNFLLLKAEITNEDQNQWRDLRDKITNLCSSSPLPGRKTNALQGTWVSTYKWAFNFSRQSITEIAKNTISVLDYVHPKLKVIS